MRYTDSPYFFSRGAKEDGPVNLFMVLLNEWEKEYKWDQSESCFFSLPGVLFCFLMREEWWEKISFLWLAVFSLYHLTYSSWYWSLLSGKKLILALHFHWEKGKWHNLECPNRCVWGGAGEHTYPTACGICLCTVVSF